MNTKRLIFIVVALAAIGSMWWRSQPTKLDHQVEVKLPALAGIAADGAAVFAENCSVCHGDNASGGEGGPPLIHKIYEPSHHGDASFMSAIFNGVRAHHWGFGNMEPVEGVNEQDAIKIIAYIRTVQRANGIQ